MSLPQLADTPGAGVFDQRHWQMQLRASVALTHAIKILRHTEGAPASEHAKIARSILIGALCHFNDPKTTIAEIVEVLLDHRKAVR